MKNTYAENVSKLLRKKGYGPKYEHPGIYCIKLDDQIVYIGKSLNMLERVAHHYVGIQTGSELKYRIISEVQNKGRVVGFDTLYYAQSTNEQDVIEEIGQKEGELIRQHLPLLNTQIPKEENWHSWTVQKLDAEAIIAQLLEK